MNFHKQTILHDPANGKFGNCMQTVIASMIYKEPGDVPNFNEGGPSGYEFNRRLSGYLDKEGFQLIAIPFSGDCTLQQLMRTIDSVNPNTIYLLTGRSGRGNNHVVICKGDDFLHDPHPDNTFISAPCDDGFYWIEFVVPKMTSYLRMRWVIRSGSDSTNG